MKYVKLIDGEIVFAPNPIKVNNYYIGNPSGEIYKSQGYKELEYTDPPEVEDGYEAISGWEELEDKIVQIWTTEFIPTTDEEALTRYANELTGANDETLEEATERLIKIIKEDN